MSWEAQPREPKERATIESEVRGRRCKPVGAIVLEVNAVLGCGLVGGECGVKERAGGDELDGGDCGPEEAGWLVVRAV